MERSAPDLLPWRLSPCYPLSSHFLRLDKSSLILYPLRCMILEKTQEEETTETEIRGIDLEAYLGKGTYRTIAERAQLSPRHVGRILNGQVRKPGLETIQKISKASGIEFDLLVLYIKNKRESRRVRQYSSNKLSEIQIEQIKKMKGTCTTREAALRMQVSRTTISSIWSSV